MVEQCLLLQMTAPIGTLCLLRSVVEVPAVCLVLVLKKWLLSSVQAPVQVRELVRYLPGELDTADFLLLTKEGTSEFVPRRYEHMLAKIVKPKRKMRNPHKGTH